MQHRVLLALLIPLATLPWAPSLAIAQSCDTLVTLTGDVWDYFGRTVSNAGDLNGDGFDDVIVGLSGNNFSGVGRAYAFYGGPTTDTLIDLIFTGQVAYDNFGGEVSGAGDINGDGFDDVIVGAYFNNAGGGWAGRAYVFYCGPSVDNTPDLVFTGEHPEDYLGRAVSGAGDVNGDGYDDLIVGAEGSDALGYDTGRAYLYFGGPGANNTPNLVLTGERWNNFFGCSVSSAGDMNGDGFDDVVVGAFGNSGGAPGAGRAYVFYGGPGIDAIPDLVFTGETAGDCFGTAVSGAGDVNGDGFSDAIVGAYNNDTGGDTAGRAYVFYGGPQADDIPDLVLTGEKANDYFGIAVSTAGDGNSDGFDDIIVGAFGGGVEGSNTGRAYIFHGGIEPDANPDLILTGEADGDNFGTAVSGVGDVDGDGYDEVVVGASHNDAGGGDAGRVYVFSCPPPMTPGVTILVHGFKLNGDGVLGDTFSPVGHINPGLLENSYWSYEIVSGLLSRFGGGRVFVFTPASGRFVQLDPAEYPEYYQDGLGDGPHIVLAHDWAFLSNDAEAGQAEAAAEALFAALVSADIPGCGTVVNLSQPELSKPLHFVGHSRGAIVASETIQRLGWYGVSVNYFTSLDPHDFGENGPDFSFHDPATQVWSNVLYADNYWQEMCDLCGLTCPLIPSGRRLPHLGIENYFWNHELTDLPEVSANCLDPGDGDGHGHGRVTDWYAGTIRPGTMRSDWYRNDGYFAGFNLWQAVGGFGYNGTLTCIEGPADPRTFVGLLHFNGDDDDDYAPPYFFNGDFDLRDLDGSSDETAIAGWGFHGGGGDAYLHGDEGNRYLQFETGNRTRRHNRFYLPANATGVKFKWEVTNSSPSALLRVQMDGEVGGRPTTCVLGELPIASEHGFVPETLPIPPECGSGGSVQTLTFEIVGGVVFKVNVDDIDLVIGGHEVVDIPVGTNVVAQLGSDVALTLPAVSNAGICQLFVDASDVGPNGWVVVPSNNPVLYDISTTGQFSGQPEVCITYDPATVIGVEGGLRLMHCVTNAGTPYWQEITSSLDMASNTICGLSSSLSQFAVVEPASPTGIPGPGENPGLLRLYASSPNPVRNGASIRFDLSSRGPVSLEVFDLAGRRVAAVIESEDREVGQHSVFWDGRSEDGRRVSSGIYLYRLKTQEQELTRKLVVLH